MGCYTFSIISFCYRTSPYNISMAVLSSEIKFYYSGGTTNSSPANSIGGSISSVEISASLHSLFDIVGVIESRIGDTEYRCMYVKNTNNTSSLFDILVWITNSSLTEGLDLSLGLAVEGINGTAELLASEGVTPSSVVFSTPTSFSNALTIAELQPSEYHAIWIKRVLAPNTPTIGVNSATIIVEGQSE